MNEELTERALLFLPENPGEAARLFAECSRLSKGGREIRIGLLESPYRPGFRFGLPNLAGIDIGGNGSNRLDVSEGSYRELQSPSLGNVPVFTKPEDLFKEIESAGREERIVVLASHSRMNTIHEISTPDLLAVVGGGVRYGDLIREVEEANLYFPYERDLPVNDETVAELVMNGGIPATEGRYGGLREYVLSVELVTPKGDIVTFGSRAVKDVAGYEVISFLLGMGGLCGMISRVTLRLLPAPPCRAVFAGRAELRTLKTLAHHIFSTMRPAFLEIFEDEAAELLIEHWEKRLRAEGRSLPPILRSGKQDPDIGHVSSNDRMSDSGEGREVNESTEEEKPAGKEEAPSLALLVGELQGLETVVEKQLLRIVSGDPTGRTSLVLIKQSLLEERRRFPLHVVKALDRGGGILHLSYDAVPLEIDVSGVMVHRSLYPERIHIYMTLGESSALYIYDKNAVQSRLDSAPGSKELLASVIGSGLRVRMEIIESRTGAPVKVKIHPDAMRNILSSEKGGSSEEDRQAKILQELDEKVLKLFDPQGVMLL